MSTISVNYINGLGEAALRSVSGVAAAWVNFDGVAATITNSNAISSLTDNGTGDYTVSFSNSFDATDYVVHGAKAYSNSAYINANSWWVKPRLSTDLATGSSRFYSGYTGGGSTGLQDSEYNVVMAHGDLA